MTQSATTSRSGAGSFLALDRFLVPADAPEIANYFLDRLFVSHGHRERLLRTVMKAGTLRGRGRRTLRGRGVLLGESLSDLNDRYGTDHSEPVRGWRKAFSLLGESPLPGQFLREMGLDEIPLQRTILLRDYSSAGRGRLLLFPFPEGSSQPAAVIKLKWHEGGGNPLREERNALLWTRSRINDPVFLGSIPEPLGFQATPEIEVLVLSHLDGRAAYWDQQNRLFPGRKTGSHMEAAADWLAAFHRICGADPLAGTGPSHGDFWARNLLLPSLKETPPGPFPFIVDWESFDPSGPASYDLFHFPLTYVRNQRWGANGRLPFPRAFQKGLLAPGLVSRAIEGYFSRYCVGVGLNPSELDGLFRRHIRDRGLKSREPERSAWQQCLELLESSSSAVSRCAH